MKLIQTLAPIASLALAVNGEYQKPVSGSQDVKFAQGGVEKVLDVKANGSKGDIKGAMSAVKGFFDSNPGVLKSILKVVNDPKYKKTRDEISRGGVKLHSEAVKNPDSEAVKVKAINYVYQHPDILKLAGAIGKQVANDHPTLIENGFVELEKAATKNPEIFKKIRAKAIEFSDKHEDAHEKIVEMVLKSALQDVKLSANIAKKALKLDQIICSGSGSTDCACETDSAYGKPEPEVKSPEVDAGVPEVETSEPEPEVDAGVPEVETSDPEPEVDAGVPEVETSEPEPEVDAGVPEVETSDPEPEVDAGVPEVETSEPEPEVDAGVPEVETSDPEPKVDAGVSEVETSDPEPKVDAGVPEVETSDPEPKVDAGVPEVETSEPEPEVDAGVPEVETFEPEPEVDAGVPEVKTSEPKPEVDAEVPEVETSDPGPEVDAEVPEVQKTSKLEEVGYARPSVKGETPEVTDPVEPTSEPPFNYARPSKNPKAILDPK